MALERRTPLRAQQREHECQVLQGWSYEVGRRGPICWVECSCGWRGPDRVMDATALADHRQHITEVMPHAT
jgi:hypothetical protein